MYYIYGYGIIIVVGIQNMVKFKLNLVTNLPTPLLRTMCDIIRNVYIILRASLVRVVSFISFFINILKR